MNKLLTNYEQIMNGCKCISMQYACISMQNYGKNFVHNLFTFYSQKIYQKFTIAKIAPPMVAGGAPKIDQFA